MAFKKSKLKEIDFASSNDDQAETPDEALVNDQSEAEIIEEKPTQIGGKKPLIKKF